MKYERLRLYLHSRASMNIAELFDKELTTLMRLWHVYTWNKMGLGHIIEKSKPLIAQCFSTLHIAYWQDNNYMLSLNVRVHFSHTC